MAFTDTAASSSPLANINVTPLVDVMLVLLIIFMVTTPILSRPVPFELPQRGPPIPVENTDPLRLNIAANGVVLWEGTPLAPAALQALLRAEASRSPQPLLQIEAHRDSQYQSLTRLVASARNAGLTRVGVVD